jgi:uncharacterized SAM-dependent methyltransferase
MLSTAQVVIHQSQFPENVRRDLLQSLQTHRVNHKFHYDSVKQTNKWLALHQTYSPSRNDLDCAATYDRAFADTVCKIRARRVHVVGLGCGGGQKDTRLLKLLKRSGKTVAYTPSDVSVAMALVARQTACRVVSAKECFPLVCDLANSDDLPAVLSRRCGAANTRLITFFGMIPNFEPGEILSKLAQLVRRNDTLLFSANLAPGSDYAVGVRKILPQYDNKLTREWLLAFLLDLGVERRDGELRLGIEPGSNSLRRVVARFHFKRSRIVQIEGKNFDFGRGEDIRLFFSYRYTPTLVREQLARHDLRVSNEWITSSGEEGVFLCRRQ